MDTTISDLAKFIAALVRGDGLSMAARTEMVKPSLPIGTAHQFPNFAPYLPKAEQRPDLAAGLGVIVFEGPKGRGFYKGGHDLFGLRHASLIWCALCSAKLASPDDWEYGDRAGKS